MYNFTKILRIVVTSRAGAFQLNTAKKSLAGSGSTTPPWSAHVKEKWIIEDFAKLVVLNFRLVLTYSWQLVVVLCSVALQLGPTEASRYFIYWVPAQYVDSIKDAVLGKWQFF